MLKERLLFIYAIIDCITEASLRIDIFIDIDISFLMHKPLSKYFSYISGFLAVNFIIIS